MSEVSRKATSSTSSRNLKRLIGSGACQGRYTPRTGGWPNPHYNLHQQPTWWALWRRWRGMPSGGHGRLLWGDPLTRWFEGGLRAPKLVNNRPDFDRLPLCSDSVRASRNLRNQETLPPCCPAAIRYASRRPSVVRNKRITYKRSCLGMTSDFQTFSLKVNGKTGTQVSFA